MVGWMDGWTEEMDGQKDGWMNRWTGGRMDGRTDGWTDRQTQIAALARGTQPSLSFLGKQVRVQVPLLPSITSGWDQRRKGINNMERWGHLPRERTCVPKDCTPGCPHLSGAG